MSQLEGLLRSINRKLSSLEIRETAALEQHQREEENAEDVEKEDEVQLARFLNLRMRLKMRRVAADNRHASCTDSVDANIEIENSCCEEGAAAAVLRITPFITEKATFTVLEPLLLGSYCLGTFLLGIFLHWDLFAYNLLEPITKPWRTSKQPWSSKKEIPQNHRKITSILNKCTLLERFGADLAKLLKEDNANVAFFFSALIRRVLGYRKHARLFINVFIVGAVSHVWNDTALVARKTIVYAWTDQLFKMMLQCAVIGCAHVSSAQKLYKSLPRQKKLRYEPYFLAIFPEITEKRVPLDAFMKDALEERTQELERTNRQRMCGWLALLAELQKHKIAKIEILKLMLLSLITHSREEPLDMRDCYDFQFVVKWIVRLYKKISDGLFEPERYDDEMENYVHRNTPKWKKDVLGPEEFAYAFFGIDGTIDPARRKHSTILLLNQITEANTRTGQGVFMIIFNPNYHIMSALAQRVVNAGIADRGRNAGAMALYAAHLVCVRDEDRKLWMDIFFKEIDRVREKQAIVAKPEARREINDRILGHLVFVGSLHAELTDCGALVMNEPRVAKESRGDDNYASKWYRNLYHYIHS